MTDPTQALYTLYDNTISGGAISAIKTDMTYCARCGRDGVVREWDYGIPHCAECNISAREKSPPNIRGHWCEGLQRLQEGTYSGTPRLTTDGFLISVGDEYSDEENPTPIKFCPMCGVKLEPLCDEATDGDCAGN